MNEIKEKYPYLKESVDDEMFEEMKKHYSSELLKMWDEECRVYLYEYSDKDIGECGENLSRFQVVVFGGGNEELKDYLAEFTDMQ